MNNFGRDEIEQALYDLLRANQVFTGTLTGTVVSGIDPFQWQGLYYGEVITGGGLPTGTIITDKSTKGTVTLSNAGTNGSASLTAQTFKDTSRRVISPDNVATERRPFMCVFPKPETYVAFGPGSPPEITLEADVLIYTSAMGDQSGGPPPISMINPIIDALVSIKLAPDLLTLRQTLGADVNGIPYCIHAYVEGQIIKSGGDIDGLGIAIIPIKMLVPW